MTEVPVTVGGDEDHIFDANTEFTGQVDAGLDGDDRVLPDGLLGFRAGEGVLVDLDADAVAGAVAEVLAVACVRDDVAAGLVEVEGRDARADIVEARLLCLADGLVDVDHLFGRLGARRGASRSWRR